MHGGQDPTAIQDPVCVGPAKGYQVNGYLHSVCRLCTLSTDCAQCLQTCTVSTDYSTIWRRRPSNLLLKYWHLIFSIHNRCTVSTTCARCTPCVTCARSADCTPINGYVHGVYKMCTASTNCAHCLQTVHGVCKLCTASIDYSAFRRRWPRPPSQILALCIYNRCTVSTTCAGCTPGIVSTDCARCL